MYERALNTTLKNRLNEPRRFIQVLAGPRQVGKTTSINQVLPALELPYHYASADAPALQTASWLESQWNIARARHKSAGTPVVLALDEIQKIPRWSEWVKLYWDGDTRAGADVRVVILGSSPLLIERGLSEALTGRFEIVHATHWLFSECRDAFGWDLDTFVYHGGYPGAATLIEDHDRWRAYILDSIVETSISRDVQLLSRIDKPALLRQLFLLACDYSGQILSYTKMLGQLRDARNTTTLAHYLRLLSGAGLVKGLDKYSGSALRRRASSPKLNVFNTALMSSMSAKDCREARRDPAYWGRLVESSVGSFLLADAVQHEFDLYYWRKGDYEVDFVLVRNEELLGIEVKSGGSTREMAGLEEFHKTYPQSRSLVVGADGIPLESFLAGEVDPWSI
ncbi:MAG: ATP-binding protein [Actinobacteria bacterium]|nr:MAG: ATP-binding protein [Actinomycetota bacterium]